MATKSSKKHIHSFSTNFFGVVGYIGSSLVWLLVLTCTVLLLPSDNSFISVSETSRDATVVLLPGTSLVGESNISFSPFFSFLLTVLALIVFWAFSYFASRVLSRIVRRVVGLFHEKVTSQSLLKTKYFIHAIGLVLLAMLLLIIPGFIWLKISISFIGMLGGISGLCAIWLQYHVAKRHHVPIARIL